MRAVLLLSFLLVPAIKLLKCLAVIPLGIGRRATVGGQVLKKLAQPGIIYSLRLRRIRLSRLHMSGRGQSELTHLPKPHRSIEAR